MGLTNVQQGLRNVHTRTLVNPMGRRNTHGSFVASIIGHTGRESSEASALSRTSPSGPTGIVPDAQIYLADVSDEQGHIYTANLTKAIEDATDLGVDIISISLGTDKYDQKLESAVNRAASKGILVFAASGNCGCRTYEFPAACSNAISVASMDHNRKLSSFNTRNDAVAVFAPGQNIKVPGSQRLSGTSFAVPFASGLAALELSRRRLTESSLIMTRQETIHFLRSSLGLDCGIHTYSTDVCTDKYAGGSFEATDPRPKFLIQATIGLFIIFLILEKIFYK